MADVDKDSFAAWFDEKFARLDSEIKLLRTEPNAAYIGDLCPSFHREALEHSRSLKLTKVSVALGSEPVTYFCVGRDDGIQLYEEFIEQLAGGYTALTGKIPPSRGAIVVSPNDDRDKWFHGKRLNGESLESILMDLREHPKWKGTTDNVEGIRKAIKAYCKRHELPEIRRYKTNGKPEKRTRK